MTKPHRFSANVILRVLLAYKAREGEYPSQRALAVEADRSLAHVNAMVKFLEEKGFIRLSKAGGRIIEARDAIVPEHTEQEKQHDPI